MPNPYLNNKNFEILLKEFSTLDKRHKRYKPVQTEIANMLLILAKNIQATFKFKIDPDDCIQDSLIVCLSKLERYDPTKGRAFNYFTTTILNHFRQIYRKEKGYMNFKSKLFDELTKSNKGQSSQLSIPPPKPHKPKKGRDTP